MVLLQGSAKSASLEETLIISEQLKRCICKIEINDKTGTGFFCFISYNNKMLPVLISASYVIRLTNELEEINITLNDISKKINIKDGRKTYMNDELFVTIIEIIPEKDLIFDFLALEENIFKVDNANSIFKGESLYTLKYSINDKLVSYGLCISIEDNKNIRHSCNTESMSGGSPILSMTNDRVIGIHTGSPKYYNFNYGYFLKIPITEFINLNKDYINLNGIS